MLSNVHEDEFSIISEMFDYYSRRIVETIERKFDEKMNEIIDKIDKFETELNNMIDNMIGKLEYEQKLSNKNKQKENKCECKQKLLKENKEKEKRYEYKPISSSLTFPTFRYETKWLNVSTYGGNRRIKIVDFDYF